MGFITGMVKDKRKRLIINIIKEGLFLFIFIILIINTQFIWDDGFMTCRRNCVCYHTVKHFNETSPEDITENCSVVMDRVYCINDTLNPSNSTEFNMSVIG